MTYQKLIHHICLSLSLRYYPERKEAVQTWLTSATFKWEHLVQTLSGHLVIPAFYINLQHANLLQFLPKDLEDYLAQITDLNRERNRKLIQQAKALNTILIAESQPPLFLKGTAFLLCDLYADYAERMVGDIDFLVPKGRFKEVACIIKKQGYAAIINEADFDYINAKHYPRLVHEHHLAAVEVHQTIISPEYKNPMPYEVILAKAIKHQELWTPATEHLLWHNILNTQLNDKGYWFHQTTLRHYYDAFLLWHHPDIGLTGLELTQYPQCQSYLAVMTDLFKVLHNSIPESKKIKRSRFWFQLSLKYPKATKIFNKLTHIRLRIQYLWRKILQVFVYKDQRTRIIKLLKTPKKYVEHLYYFNKK